MSGFKGQKNIYVCRECRGHIVTVDLDEGVTPFLLPCKETLKCVGLMQSSMYRVYDQEIKADWEWYKPTMDERRKLNPFAQEHVTMGGLLLRKVNLQ